MNLIAPINQLGYGQVGTYVLRELASRKEVSLFPIGPIDSRKQDSDIISKSVANSTKFDYNSPSLRIWHQFDMAMSVGRGQRLGYTFFELDRLFENEVHQLNSLDHLFVSCQWAKNVCEYSGVNIPIHVANPGADLTIFNNSAPKERFPGTKESTTVFFNCGKWEVRKGHDFLLEVFNAAFEPDDDVMLVMNCFNPCLDNIYSEEWSHHYMTSKMGRAGKILVIKDRVETQAELAAIMNGTDCGVFPARAEGWNMEPVEMAAMNKPLILTNYSAHTEYINKFESLSIDCDKLELADDGHFFHPESGGCWATLGEKQFEQAVAHMRHVHIIKKSLGNLAFKDIKNSSNFPFSWKGCVDSLMSTTER